MHSIRRSCQLALQNSRYAFLYAPGSRRAFSQSPVHSRGALPNFLPPSSPELSELLSTFNSKVLLPYHLTPEQQKLVYSKESRTKLEAEPVEITLGDVTLTLEHLNRNILPNRWRVFRKVVAESESEEDWENVLRCLEGFEEAGLKPRPEWQEMVVRKLNLAGMHHLILKALQRSKATGISLSNRGVLEQVMRALHNKASVADWEQEETMKALKMAKQVVELMENEEHFSSRPQITPTLRGDWRSQPVVIALPTELAAVVAEKYNGDKEQVKKLANRLVAAIKQTQYMNSLDDILAISTKTEADFTSITVQLNQLAKYSDTLVETIIVWNALKTSRKVLGSDMPMADEAQQFEAKAEQVLMQCVANLDTLMTRNGKPLKAEYADMVKVEVEKCRMV